jgi:hypothetical protein
MPTRPEVRRDSRRGVDGNSSATASAPVDRGLRAAHADHLVARPGEVPAAVAEPLQGAAGEITERSEA